MRSLRIVIAASLLVTSLVHAQRDGDAPERLQRLESGEILVTTQDVPGRSLPRVKATGLVQAPPGRVWPIIDDCSRYETTMPRTLESEELERDGEDVRCRVVLSMPFPFSDLVAVTDAVHTTKPGDVYERKWTHRSGDFEVNDGSWTLEPYGQDGKRTLATYEALIEPNVPIPDFIMNTGTRVTLPGMIEALREHTGERARTNGKSP